jgi:hypothetical protein
LKITPNIHPKRKGWQTEGIPATVGEHRIRMEI